MPEIRDEEYVLLAFGMEWIVSKVLRQAPKLSAPRLYLIDGRPDLGRGKMDLVYWWHDSVEKFSRLRNEARIDLLRKGEEEARFARQKFRDLGLEIGTLSHTSLPRVEKWEFKLSRVGMDEGSRQAIAHIQAKPECDDNYSFGMILVITWEPGSGEMDVLHAVPTVLGPE